MMAAPLGCTTSPTVLTSEVNIVDVVLLFRDRILIKPHRERERRIAGEWSQLEPRPKKKPKQVVMLAAFMSPAIPLANPIKLYCILGTCVSLIHCRKQSMNATGCLLWFLLIYSEISILVLDEKLQVLFRPTYWLRCWVQYKGVMTTSS